MIKEIYFNEKKEQICIGFVSETLEEQEWLDENDICEEDEEGTNDEKAIKELCEKVQKTFPDLKIEKHYF